MRNDFIGFGANWGRPPTDTTRGQIEDQYSFEAYYRLQLPKHLAITPAVQFVQNPAWNLSVANLWILGVRVRLAF